MVKNFLLAFSKTLNLLKFLKVALDLGLAWLVQ